MIFSFWAFSIVYGNLIEYYTLDLKANMNTQWLFIIPSPVAVKHIYTHIHMYKTNVKQTQVEMLGYLVGVGAGSWYCLITNQHIPLREEISVFLLQGVREHIAEFKKKTKSTIHNTEFVFG